MTTSYDRAVNVGGSYNGALVRTTTEVVVVDSATGTPYDVTTTTTELASANGVQPGASYIQRVYTPTASFSSTPSSWCMGRPGQTQLINSHNQYGGGSITRTTDITWDTTTCRPTQIVQELGHGQLQVTRTLGYDGFGNLNSDSATGSGMAARTTTANWGTTGQFPVSVTNALSQTTNKTWNYAFGVQASETDPNGVVVSWQYDDFGRMSRENRPDGTAVTRTFNSCPAPGYCGYTALRYYVETSLINTASAVVRNDHQFFDMLDRLRFDEPLLVTGARVQTATEYDALGRVASRSSPRFSTGMLYQTQFQYDLLDRVTQASRPASDSNPSLVTTTTVYEGLTTRVVDPLGKQSSKVANVAGTLARSIDHDGYHKTYDYDAFGNLVRVTDSLSNTLQSNTFNIRGMRTGQTDMHGGYTSFTPNALGELTSQTDAESLTTTFGYDLLGRMTSRVEPEGTSTFTFGTSVAAKNIGRLAGMSGPGYSEGYAYDNIGRLQQRSITSDATYTFDYSYNNQGMLDTLTYPVSTSSYRLKLQYEYQSGQLARVKDFNAPTTVFWQVNSADPWGHVIDETRGNGVQSVRGYDLVTGRIDFIQSGASGSIQNLNYTWDAVGNLTQRQDVRQSLTENFSYDNLYRLTGATGPDPFTVGYDPRGNITSRTGNVSPAATHTITWYSYNLPNTITASGSQSSQFFYAPDRSRWKQVASYGGTIEQSIYIGGLVEKVTLGTLTSWKHYIAGTSGTIAIYTRKSSGTNELHYLTSDHLGSLDSVTNASGAVEVRLSFGVFGQRRNEDTWSGSPTSGDWTGITNTTRRGFTSHEMLDNLNMTHMNGRVYDQLIGQFTSADPFIDGAHSTRGWNRYSYVHNNPLSFTDPSGYSSTIKSWIDKFPALLNFYMNNRMGGGRNPSEVGGGGGGRGGGGGGDPGDDGADEPKNNDGEKCTLADLLRDIENSLKEAIFDLPTLSIALEAQGTFGLDSAGQYSQYSFSAGVNSSRQAFAQMQGSDSLQGDGDIAVLSLGINVGFSSSALRTDLNPFSEVQVASAFMYVGGGVSAGTEYGSGSGEGSLPDSLVPRGLGRLNTGIGLAAGRVHGTATETTAASDPMFGLIDPPTGYSGCGGKF